MSLRDSLKAAGLRTIRRALSLRRPTPQANRSGLAARQESLDEVTLRELRVEDIPDLAELHVSAWNDTYAPLMTGPSVEIREMQWRQAFEKPADWFCLVLVNSEGRIIGFAKGGFRRDHEIPGELNKLFLAREYQRLGLGRRLMGEVARRFGSAGVSSMAAYVDPRNPSCGFFEHLGGRWLIEDP